MAKKVCKKCRVFVESGNCPICKGNQLTDNWKGKVIILSEESEIGKKLNLKGKGEFAIRVM